MTSNNFSQLHFLVFLLVLALANSEGPKPGDTINFSTAFPQWWHDLKDEHESREVRKCVFLQEVPHTGSSCPGVSKRDHFYCVYGDNVGPSWICTCIEKVGQYKFHCGTDFPTAEELAALVAVTVAPVETSAPGADAHVTDPPIDNETPSSGGGLAADDENTQHSASDLTAQKKEAVTLKEDGSFVGGLLTGVFLMSLGMFAVFVVHRNHSVVGFGRWQQPVSTNEGASMMAKGIIT